MSESGLTELELTVGRPANGGSCVARHEGLVVFVRYALPGERVRVRVTASHGSYWHADCIEVIAPSADRIVSLCPIAGADGAGCCDLGFVDPTVARALKGEVVADQLARLGGLDWQGAVEPLGSCGGPSFASPASSLAEPPGSCGGPSFASPASSLAEPPGSVGPTGWRTRVRLEVGGDGHAGFHRYHRAELVTDLRCGQLPAGMVDGLPSFEPGDQVHVAIDDDGARHVVSTARHRRPRVVEGGYYAVQRVTGRHWQVPVTAFWQAHRDAAGFYSALVADWAQLGAGMTVWDLYGGAGVFAAVLGAAVGASGRVLTVDTARVSSRAARTALADLPQVRVVTDSVRRAVAAQRRPADVAVLDPPRAGAGRGVIDLLAAAAVPRVIHIGCDAASFSRDIGLYRGRGYHVEQLRVFDAFPLTHHVECVALLTAARHRIAWHAPSGSRGVSNSR